MIGVGQLYGTKIELIIDLCGILGIRKRKI